MIKSEKGIVKDESKRIKKGRRERKNSVLKKNQSIKNINYVGIQGKKIFTSK